MLSSQMHDPHAIEALLQYSRQHTGKARTEALLALGNAGESRVLDPLISLYTTEHDKDPKAADTSAGHEDEEGSVSLDLRVIEAIGGINDPRATDFLLAHLHDPSHSVSLYAAVSLGKRGDKRAIEPLLRAMLWTKEGPFNFDYPPVIRLLGQFKDSRAIWPLIAALHWRGDDPICAESVKALTAITGQHFGEDASRWRKWWSAQNVRQLESK